MYKKEKGRHALRRLLRVIAGHRAAVLVTLLFAAISSLAAVFATLQLGIVIDSLDIPPPGFSSSNIAYPLLLEELVALAALYLVSALFLWFTTLMANRVAFRTARDLRGQAFDKLGKLPLAYFDGHAHGDLVSRFTGDLDNISDALAMGIVNLFSGAVVVVSSLVLMLRLHAGITLVILLVTPLCFLVAYVVARASQNSFTRQQAVVGELSGFVNEMVGSQKTVKALGYELRSAERFREINARLHKIGRQAQFASSLVNPSARVVDHISYLLVGVVGGFIAIGGGVSIGVISSFLIYSGQFSKPFNDISGIMSNLQTAFASLGRVLSVLDEAEESADAPDAEALTAPRGAVSFEHAAFSYDKTRPLIEDLNLRVEPGSLVAIVGPTGAGKTTIVNLLMRFYDLGSGEIRIDGHPAASLTRDSLRRGFGMVLQETWLFLGTVRDNIAYGKPDATDEEVVAAAKAAYAHSFIRQLERGYDTLIAEDGGNLSQGQRQLLTIARVMLTSPAMLILDEATSSIDTLTERRVQRAFLELMRGRTSFVIAHRLSTIVGADRILVLDKGRIVETGTHGGLLERNGFYAALYRSQFE